MVSDKLPAKKPSGHSATNNDQNYNCNPEILGFLAFVFPLCCYPPQEQSYENANYRVDHPRVEERGLQFESEYRATGDEA